MIELKNVSFSYKHKPCIRNVNLSFNTGAITAVIGPNGSGKSTLLKLCSRLLRCSGGEVLLEGINIFDIKPKAFAKRAAILLQANHPPNIPAYDYVMSGRYPHKSLTDYISKEDINIVENAMEMTGCHVFAQRPVNKLSGGERQKVFIAMALAQNTDIIFLDEPTTFFDINVSFDIMNLIQKLNEKLGKTIILVVHDLNLALHYSDYAVIINNGEIVIHEKTASIAENNYISNVFGVEMKKIIDAGNEFFLFKK
ncbi:MAG: ABC transporter ATP-binding protein [Firmicutes bacterium]|nr:ABC transporter ATP-binding protein [Bacillota bacterium]